ncbi:MULTISPECIES: hypothetical protein [unclassified Photobacterium]|uniref:hypothetical protein n=1 Tax=unclassified Photobacterium TaxID=2628852 RepID=UPI000D15A028|nr:MULTISPECIES: hypothetical protein [unclassified Photobacterium]PSV32893.1 hypothetical protein C9J40_00065 [Photobacterium sp. GB-72]PSV50169.1 hypothetical protein C9J45_21290 [Photobacterium sp. GB-1]
MKFRLILIALVFTASSVYANDMPSEVLALKKAFQAIPGIRSAEVGKHHFSKEDIVTLNEVYFSGEYADLPISMYRRSGGNLNNEILINVAFEIQKNALGLQALEFLSWWVRDLSRSGDNVQIRAIGLPPIVGDKVQLGDTLSFWFEAYIVTEREDMGLVLNEISDLTQSLNTSFNLYKSAFNQ